MTAVAAYVAYTPSPAQRPHAPAADALTAQTALAQRRLFTTLTLAITLHALTLALAIELPGTLAPAQRMAVQIIGQARQTVATPPPVAPEPQRETSRPTPDAWPATTAMPPPIPPTFPATSREPDPAQTGASVDPRPAQDPPADNPANRTAPIDANAAATDEPVAVPARVDTAYLDNPRPAYPPLSRKLGEEGTVILRVEVNAEGSATSAAIERSSGFPRLDEAARKVALRWRFVAARRGDVREASTVRVPIRFSLSAQ